MKIGIVSDAHLFHKCSQIDIFKNVISELQNKVDIIVDCGDLLDKNILNSKQAFDLFNVFKDVKIPYHIVKGNHDALEGVSLASLLPMNKNIIVHNNIEFAFYDKLSLLFVPYTDNIKELFKNLKICVLSPSDYAFSHLNITNNIYASLPFSKAQKLFLYADTWINGHIHTPEKFTSIEGTIYNPGSLSSLTFGDEHIPSYNILDTDTNKLQQFEIPNSIIHKTIFSDFDFESYAKEHKNMKIDWRVKIPNNFFVEERQNIKEKLQNIQNTNSIQFDYLKINKTNTNRINEMDNSKNKDKKPLILQLIEQYNKDTGESLSEDIIKELTEEL